jgi:hypothetical protein
MAGMRYLARRLDEQGHLRPDVSQREATDILWVLTSLDTFDLLHTGRGLSPTKTADRLIQLADRTLLRDPVE